jgi:hypothetical protein
MASSPTMDNLLSLPSYIACSNIYIMFGLEVGLRGFPRELVFPFSRSCSLCCVL